MAPNRQPIGIRPKQASKQASKQAEPALASPPSVQATETQTIEAQAIETQTIETRNPRFQVDELCQEGDRRDFEVRVRHQLHVKLKNNLNVDIHNHSGEKLRVASAMRVVDEAGQDVIPLQTGPEAEHANASDKAAHIPLHAAFKQLEDGYYAIRVSTLGVGSKGEQSASHSAYVRLEDGVAEFVDYGEWYFGSGHASHGYEVKE